MEDYIENIAQEKVRSKNKTNHKTATKFDVKPCSNNKCVKYSDMISCHCIEKMGVVMLRCDVYE